MLLSVSFVIDDDILNKTNSTCKQLSSDKCIYAGSINVRVSSAHTTEDGRWQMADGDWIFVCFSMFLYL